MSKTFILAFGSLLVENLRGEDVEEFRLFVAGLLKEIYGQMPDWVKFNIGPRYEWRGKFYRSFLCPAGSVDGNIQLHVGKPPGVERGIILRGTRSGKPCCCEVRMGIETEFDCTELRQVKED